MCALKVVKLRYVRKEHRSEKCGLRNKNYHCRETKSAQASAAQRKVPELNVDWISMERGWCSVTDGPIVVT